MRKAILVALFLAAAPVSSDTVIPHLKTAYEIAKQDGIQDPSILQGIILVESNARSHVISNGNYGIAQVRLNTARLMQRLNPELRSKEPLERKLLDAKFNMRVASKYLLYLQKMGMHSDTLIAAYNRGHRVRNPGSLPYVKKVRARISRLAITST